MLFMQQIQRSPLSVNYPSFSELYAFLLLKDFYLLYKDEKQNQCQNQNGHWLYLKAIFDEMRQPYARFEWRPRIFKATPHMEVT